MSDTTRLDKLVDRFLAWKLPESVCSDLCATKQGYPHRSGTNLLNATEAKQMLEYLLTDSAIQDQYDELRLRFKMEAECQERSIAEIDALTRQLAETQKLAEQKAAALVRYAEECRRLVGLLTECEQQLAEARS